MIGMGVCYQDRVWMDAVDTSPPVCAAIDEQSAASRRDEQSRMPPVARRSHGDVRARSKKPDDHALTYSSSMSGPGRPGWPTVSFSIDNHEELP